MPSVVDIALVVGAVASTASAGTLSVPFKHRLPQHHFSDLSRRALNGTTSNGTLDLLAANNITGGGYYSEFQIGTPPQTINFQLDTGSSDTWVNSADSDLCEDTYLQSKYGYCQTQFDKDKSKTYELVDDGGFDITYLDKRHIQGDYFNDTVTINGHKIVNQQLGLATKSVRATGIMGLGFSANVQTSVKYPTVIDNMVDQGIIDHPIFSLFLDDLKEKSGTILFGGIDSKKYGGDLATLPLTKMPALSSLSEASSEIDSYAVSISGIKMSGADVPSAESGSVAIFDSGSTTCILPSGVAKAIQKEFNVYTESGSPIGLVDCAYAGDKSNGKMIEFEFDGKTIKVPGREMVIDAIPENLQRLVKTDSSGQFKKWDGVCMFGVGSSASLGVQTDKFYLLGDTFLRSAYVVYDMANKKIGLAQANIGTKESSVTEVKSGAKEIPKITGVNESSIDLGPESGANGRATSPSLAAVVGATLLVGMSAVFSTL